jgi:cytochrome c oxidase cbb3-type subunit 3
MQFVFSQIQLGRILACAVLGSGLLFAQGDPTPPKQTDQSAQIATGRALFQQKCAFCHGRDAGGGETGPDLTSSGLVAGDVAGDKIGVVIRNGRPEKGMPPFNLTDAEIASVAAFIHDQKHKADAHPGGRKGVAVSDLQTGNAEQGKTYFNGAGGCASCHSATGDLAGVGSRLIGLKLEERLLYPADAPAKLTVTLPSGQTVTGQLMYQDEFTVALRDGKGWYRSFPAQSVKYKVDDPSSAHIELLSKYTDDDIHNLMAYLQTLR